MLLVDLPSCSVIYLTLKTKAIQPMMKKKKNQNDYSVPHILVGFMQQEGDLWRK